MISEDFRLEVLTRNIKNFEMIVLSKHVFENSKSKLIFS